MQSPLSHWKAIALSSGREVVNFQFFRLLILPQIHKFFFWEKKKKEKQQQKKRLRHKETLFILVN